MRRLSSAVGVLLVGTAALSACSTAGVGVPIVPVPPPLPGARITLPPSLLSEDKQILHVLNRLGYGPRPGDVERVRRLGLGVYIEHQLHPEGIPDEAVAERLLAYPTLTMSTAELLRDFPRPDLKLLQKFQAGEMSRQEIRETFPPEKRPYRIVAELQAAKLVRAVLSERQLQEVMVDFWLNHFNVYAQKASVRWMLTSYERDAIRPHALGRFQDLLAATGRHPAMLFYLDNWLSVRPDFTILVGPNIGRRAGLNENYARELMELHTLGVDGGYTQTDIVEVARCFTGWSIDRPQVEGRFVFRPLPHDQGDKRVLGHVIPAGGGEADGLRVIELLARHPATARFIATKLARRFVSDEPSAALVDRAARTFLATDGDIRAVLTTIVTSPEFFSAEAYRVKIKTPLELVASAVRALDGEPTASPVPDRSDERAPERAFQGGGFTLARAVAGLGQPLYEAQSPTGYPDVAEAWVNAGALVGRMNFALDLAHNRVAGTRVDLQRLVGGADRRRPGEVLDRLLAGILYEPATAETRMILGGQLDAPEITRRASDDRAPVSTDVEKLAALVLGSPEFQRR